jgi:hypothetical protein
MSPPLTGASSIDAPSEAAFSAKPAGHAGGDAAHVDDDGARLQRAEDAVGPIEHPLDVRGVRDHGDHPGGLLRDVGGGGAAAGAGGDELVDRPWLRLWTTTG